MTEGPGSDYPGQHENRDEPGTGNTGQPGQFPPPGYPPPPGYAPYPGYGPPPGYAPYPGYGQPGGYGKPPAPKPGIIPLRPLGVGEILDGSFTVLKWNPKTILGLSAIVAAISGVLLAVVGYLLDRALFSDLSVGGGAGTITSSQAQSAGVAFLILFGATAVVTFVANAILTGVLTLAVGHGVLGRKETLGGAWRATLPRLGPVLAALFLSGLFLGLGLTLAIGVAAGIGFALGAGAHLIPLGVLAGVVLGLAAVVFAVIVTIRWSLIVPVTVLERTGPVKAMAAPGGWSGGARGASSGSWCSPS